ncbi:transcriptional repressor, partial [Staphylococcus aureus]|nr:transcriptional repressor [Staphylococcus aureus]
LATVYRALQTFDEAGEVDSILTESGESLYRACTTPQHHHHLLCRECGTAVEIDGPVVEQWTETIAREHGFTEATHTIEIYGRC